MQYRQVKSMQNNSSDIIVLGGGAAGLMATFTAANAGAKVVLLEKNPSCGKKLSHTGNGRCNYTNSDMRAACFSSDDPAFVEEVLKVFGWRDTISFFNRLGIFPVSRNGYFYPACGEAKGFARTFERAVKAAGAAIRTETEVHSVSLKKGLFQVLAGQEIFSAEKVILATGGKADPGTGSDGFGYRLLSDLGITYAAPLPALCPLHLSAPYDPALAGLRMQGRIEVACRGKVLAGDTGEIQFTKEGISGIPVMNVSGIAARTLSEKQPVTAKVNLLPGGIYGLSGLSELTDRKDADVLKRLFSAQAEERAMDVLGGLLPHKALPVFFKAAKIRPDLPARDMNEGRIESLLRALTNATYPVTGTAGFDRAQVTKGGVFLSDIDPATMESRQVRNLYFAGEIMNADGRCGGYNLQWAFASGHIAGLAAAEGKGRKGC